MLSTATHFNKTYQQQHISTNITSIKVYFTENVAIIYSIQDGIRYRDTILLSNACGNYKNIINRTKICFLQYYYVSESRKSLATKVYVVYI